MTKGENKTKAQDTGGLKIGKSSLIGFGAKMSLALIGFIGLVFFYRKIGSVGIGIYYTILGVGKVINSLQSGTQSAIKKRVSEVNASQSEYLGLGIIVLFVVTIITAITIIVGMYLQPQLLQIAGRFSAQEEIKRIIDNLSYLLASLGIATSLSIFGLTNQFYAGIGNPGKSQWMDTTRSLLTLGVQALLIFIGFETFGLVWGFITGTMIVTVFVIKRVNIRPSFPSKETVIRTFSYAKWSFPLGILTSFYSKLDIFLITYILGASTSGVYAPALRMTQPATFIGQSISSALVVKSSGLHSQGESIKKHVKNGFAYSGLVSLPTLFGALAMSGALMGVIFGPTARAGAEALVGLAVYQVFRSYSYPLGSVINGTDRPDILTKVRVVTIVINAPLALILVQSQGLVGVVIATAATEACRLCMMYIFLVQIKESPGLPKEIFEQLFSAIVMFCMIEIITGAKILSPTTLPTLSILIAIGVGTYFISLALVSSNFRNTLQIVAKETIL